MGAKTKGFTLLELMIVIAIIAIIAAIAIPNLKDARIAANEASAIASLRAIHSAQGIYREQDKDGNGTLDYAANIPLLSTHALIDAQLGGLTKQGYTFTTPPAANYATMFKWSADAAPEEQGDSGDRLFYIDQTGVLRYSVDQPSATDMTMWPAIGK